MLDDVEGLLDLASLNSKIAMDNLDDTVEHLRECRENLEAALSNSEELRNGY